MGVPTRWRQAGYRSAETQEILNFDKLITGAAKELAGKKMNAPIDAFKFLERLPLDQIAYIMAESGNSAAVSKIRAYLNKWRPIRSGLPQVITELTTLGMPAGAKFDAIVQQVFAMQLTGRGKTPEEREKILRKLSGIKEQPKKKEKEKKPKGAEKSQAALAVGSAAREKHAAAKEESKKAGKTAAAAKAAGKGAAKGGKKHAAPARTSSGKKSARRK